MISFLDCLRERILVILSTFVSVIKTRLSKPSPPLCNLLKKDPKSHIQTKIKRSDTTTTKARLIWWHAQHCNSKFTSFVAFEEKDSLSVL